MKTALPRPATLGEKVAGRANGAQLGAALAAVGTRILGQFLPFAETPVLVLVAPNIAKAEADLVPVRERLARNRQRTESGAVSDPKSLQALLEEIDHLVRRIDNLEELQLDAMERLEAAQGMLGEATASKTAVEDQLRVVLRAREGKLGVLGAERDQLAAEREALVATLPAELLELYGKVAEKSGGQGAALLRQGRCGGCQLEATSSDLARYREASADEVLRCEECNRILVRTAESGL